MTDEEINYHVKKLIRLYGPLAAGKIIEELMKAGNTGEQAAYGLANLVFTNEVFLDDSSRVHLGAE